MFCSSQGSVLLALLLVRLLLVGPVHRGHGIDDASEVFSAACFPNMVLLQRSVNLLCLLPKKL